VIAMTDVSLKRFRPIHLKLENVGPFRSSYEMPITDSGNEPANFFLLASRNGFGKTTILDVIHGLMRALGDTSVPSSVGGERRVPDLHPDLLSGGSAQLDIRVELESGGKSLGIIVSLFVGKETPPLIVTPSRLEEMQAQRWAPLRLAPGGANGVAYRVVDPETEAMVAPLLRAIREGSVPDHQFVPNGDSLFLPTALYFTADRRIVQPPSSERAIRRPTLAYSPAHKFVTDGDRWETSLDGLLVWYEWLGGGLFEEAAKLVNDLLFADSDKRLLGIDRHNLGAVIEVEREDGTTYRHGIGQLSHGERSLMHLLVRSAYHKTGSTILMIDEMENHLHPKWQYRLMNLLKDWIRKWPDLTVIATTHTPEMLEAFEFERSEEGLVKGGYLIEAGDL
jgi:energy-coupling factor transporter ATP-binding protein EcfA2